MKKRVLVVTPVPTHPTNSGNRARVYSLFYNLRKMGHDVYLLHIERELGDKAAMNNHWAGRFFSATYERPKKSIGTRFTRKLKSLIDKEAIYRCSIDEWYDKSTCQAIMELDRKVKFDAVIVEYVFFSKVLECFDENVLKMIDTHDVFSNRHSLYLKGNLRPTWYSTTESEEAKGLNRADVIMAIKPQEEQFFSRLTYKKIVTVGHIVPQYEPLHSVSDGKKILYVGSANPINGRSISYFIKDVFPLVRQELPNAQLLLAGRVCELVSSSGSVVKMGELTSLKSAYDQADIVINPVFFGTGLKVKNVEALGHSKPLITTSTGAEGLEEGVGTAFLVADQADAMARSIIRVLTDSKLFQTLSKNAYDFMSKYNQRNLKKLRDTLDF